MAERCASFVSDLHAAFGLLNLKNDAVRKKYDSIKYELKKIEGIILLHLPATCQDT